MIKLFVTDLDGCISYPFKTPDWEAINLIRELNQLSREQDEIPALTICTGRPFPYAEAVAQWLDIRLPFIFESAGLYHWEGNRIVTALKSTDGELEPVNRMREWLKNDVIPDYPGVIIEFTKMMDAGVVCMDETIIAEIHQRVLSKVDEIHPGMEVHATDISVNILMPGNDKLQGIRLLSEALNIGLSEMAYIGDSSGDVPALKHVKLPFAPKNAHETARQHGRVLEDEATRAVLKAYREIIEYNRKEGI
jgi:hydroxymethylpyrimidine pyrophosphatase-like HAD family hydrolase